jgi:TPP-dependent 2-oxoacid decarboxylase
MFCGFQNLYPDFLRVGVVLPAQIGNTWGMTTNNTNNNHSDIEGDETAREIQINGRTYRRRVFRFLKDGDIVLASYEGGSNDLWNMPGGFAFNYQVSDLIDADERKYNRIQRWEVEERKTLGFILKRAKSGTRPKYAGVYHRPHRETANRWLNSDVWVEVK